MKILGRRRARREAELAELDRYRIYRHALRDDVTVFGEQLAELHVDTLTAELDADAVADYQAALDCYETAKAQLKEAATTLEVERVRVILADGRFARACVLARQEGSELPQRRDPCFFDPRHGPAATDVRWTPQGGVERSIPVCRADANRLANGELPLVRIVATAGGLVPWYAADAWIHGAPGASHAHVNGLSTPSTTLRHLGEAYQRQTQSRNPGLGGGGGL
jgi:hypothetical protein